MLPAFLRTALRQRVGRGGGERLLRGIRAAFQLPAVCPREAADRVGGHVGLLIGFPIHLLIDAFYIARDERRAVDERAFDGGGIALRRRRGACF